MLLLSQAMGVKTYYKILFGAAAAAFIACLILIVYISIRPKLCFYNHLSDAISLNTARKIYYFHRTGAASAQLSDKLINEESSLLIPALLIDIKALFFRTQGADVVCADFVAMSGAGLPADRPRYPGRTAEADFDKLTDLLRSTKNSTLKHINKGDFHMASASINKALQAISNLESQTEGSFCMTRHVLESAGYAANHAVTYQKNSAGRTDAIMSELIASQLQVIDSFGPEIDRGAQKIHRLDIGIICNDLPPIPI